MTPDEMRKNAAIVRGLRESLNHLPFEMHAGIQAAIELYTGKAEAQPAPPPELIRNSLTNRPIRLEPKVTINGKALLPPTPDNPF